MRIGSIVDMRESIKNKNPKPSADKIYYPTYVINESGKELVAMFTKEQILTAVERADNNIEDMPARKYNINIFFYVVIIAAAAFSYFMTII